MNDIYTIIMAGGLGSRFWPLSRSSMPKQFLDIVGCGRTLIQMTFDRLKQVCPAENFFVVTNIDYKDVIISQLPEIKEKQILLEPLRRNTAPCILYASHKIRMINPEAKIIVAPSDHLILQEEGFLKQIRAGIDFITNNNALLTLGLTPHYPETAYGYIQMDNKVEDDLYSVKVFTEKPDTEMAQIFLNSGEFLWNAGIFMWRLDVIMKAFELWLPEIAELFSRGEKLYGTDDEIFFINKIYSECPNISIDYGIMEKADNVYVISADFGWSDLETWGALYENKEKDEFANAIKGKNIFLYDSNNCLIDISNDKIAVIQGLDSYLVVETNDALLICKREDEHQIRQFINDVKIKKGAKYT